MANQMVVVPHHPTPEMIEAGGPEALMTWEKMIAAWQSSKRPVTAPQSQESQFGPVYQE